MKVKGKHAHLKSTNGNILIFSLIFLLFFSSWYSQHSLQIYERLQADMYLVTIQDRLAIESKVRQHFKVSEHNLNFVLKDLHIFATKNKSKISVFISGNRIKSFEYDIMSDGSVKHSLIGGDNNDYFE